MPEEPVLSRNDAETLNEPPPTAAQAFTPATDAGNPGLPTATLSLRPLPAEEVSAFCLPLPGPAGSLGRYKLHGEIGRGGMGAVLRGHDPDLGRELAIKVLHEGQGGGEALRRFLEEAQIGGQLQHPGVVPVYEVGRDGARPYFAMKLVRGQTFASLLAQRRGPADDLPRFLQVFEQVCQTLAYAHARGVIHRDLKPANIMVGAFGEVQVMDWGLAKVLGQGGSTDEASPIAETVQTLRTESGGLESRAGAVMGTPSYMPPEQARGETARIAEPADVFGLGSILCEILTGQPPFAGPSVTDTLFQAAQGDLSAAFGRLDDCGADPELVRIARSCLAADPEDRPRDAGAVARQVTAYRAGVQERLRAAEVERAAADARAGEAQARAAVEARARQEAQAKAQAERRARRLTLGLAAAVLGLLLVGGGGAVWVAHERAGRAAEEARVQQEKAEHRASVERAAGKALEEAAGLRERARAAKGNDRGGWAAALAAARRAEGLLAGGDADEELRRRVAALLAELADEEKDRRMVARLDELRLESSVKDDAFDSSQAVPLYQAAFRAYGIDPLALEPAEAAAWVARRPIRKELTGGLVGWAVVAGKGSGRLLQVVRAGARSGSFEARMLTAVQSDDRAALARLARTVDVAAVGSVPVTTLAGFLFTTHQLADAVSLLRRAQRHYPGDFWINTMLGEDFHLLRPPQNAEALRCYSAALAVRPDSPGAHFNVGIALERLGRPDEAGASYRKAIARKPDYASAHYNLGNTLNALNKEAEAEVCFRKAVEARPTFWQAWINLGNARYVLHRPAEAVVAHRRAVALAPRVSDAHLMLWLSLDAAGQSEEARAPLRRAIDLLPDDPANQSKAAWVLREKGYFAESLEVYRKLHALAAKRSDVRLPTAKWVQEAERRAELERRLPAVLGGTDQPATAEECLALAVLCKARRLYAASARLYARSFALKPAVAEDLKSSRRYDAACYAALAAAGQGRDAAAPDAEEKTRLRKQTLGWLKADLAAWGAKLGGGKADDRAEVKRKMLHWKKDSDLAGVRDREALAKLSAAERSSWENLWHAVDALLQRSQADSAM